MALAVAALGALAIWAAIVTQNQAHGLSHAGVQTSGHLRAMQALSIIDTSSDALEEGIIPAELAKLRRGQRVLDDALHRMNNGEVREARQIATRAKPIMRVLKPRIERFLARPPGYDSGGTAPREAEMEASMADLQLLLNDLDSDPSGLLTEKLASVTTSERTVRRTAFVLIPLGLVSVVVCAWLLGSYRRRSEATMRGALIVTAQEARTDQLTGLPNRRALLEEFEHRSCGDQSFTLTLADLNGFKRYNDTFGHAAGDALLRRLGGKLAAACEGRGLAARLGGDEFCVIFFKETSADEAHALIKVALTETGQSFRITAASGVAAVPADALDADGALRVADARMYATKVDAHPSAEHAVSEALTRVLDEHHPGLGIHVEEVAALARACAEGLGLPESDVRSVEHAAELHDLGKVAIPLAILTKNGPLTDEEWGFMRSHTIIGERILGGVPSLEPLASVVRASHERWDGRGYPDGLAGEHIPIAARIIFVADAFCAMTEERPYAPARSVEDARQELRKCSGTQFDPAVVTAFLEGLDRRDARGDIHASLALA